MLAYGALLELAQALTGRSPELKDLAVDLAGVLIGLGLWRLVGVRFRALAARLMNAVAGAR